MVTCLTFDACLTADPGNTSWIQAQSHTLVNIIQEVLLSITTESMSTKYWLTVGSSLSRKKGWLGELTIPV